jgi:UDP-N-acetylmuramoyl-tripeptide--D-alanyl-D-alanine ligase
MSHITLKQLQSATLGEWLCAPGDTLPADDKPCGRVVIDSRQVQPGDIFWALPGKHRDGGDFVADAFSRGAAGAVVASRKTQPPQGSWSLIVDNTQVALGRVAVWQRERFTGSIVAVTGSVGKTTTRQMIDAVLSSRLHGSVSPRNYNNHLGLPLSMMDWNPQHDYAVVELGANHQGEIGQLAELCRPRIGVVTRIGDAHLAGFGDRRGVAEAKAELLSALPVDGCAVLNGDDDELRRVCHRSRTRNIRWVGRGADCDFVASHVQSHAGALSFTVDGQHLIVPVWGRHHLTAALTAVAIGREFGLGWTELRESLADFHPPTMRCEVSTLHGAKIINDTYNANPTAMRAALELLRDFDAPGRRIVVCGDMRELGGQTVSLHRQLGDEVVTLCGADLLVACGDHAADVVAGARAAGMPRRRTVICREPREAAVRVQQMLNSGDVVLVKGSRAMGMERVITTWQNPGQALAA